MNSPTNADLIQTAREMSAALPGLLRLDPKAVGVSALLTDLADALEKLETLRLGL